MRNKRVALAIPLVVIVLIAAIVVVAAIDSGPDHAKGPPLVVSPTRSGKAVQAPKQSVIAAANGAQDVHLGAGHDTAKNARMSDRANPQAPRVSGPIPLASAFQAGCVSRFNRFNYSHRVGIRPSLGVVHLPVAFNHPGWGDVSGVHIFLDQPSTSASVNYENDAEGHCIYSVPESEKAWGQANYNSQAACSVEQQGYGTESEFFPVPSAGLRQLARIFHDCFKRWGIKQQLAQVDGRGGVIREGLIDHFHLGPAGGGHVDIHGFGAGCNQQGSGANTLACVQIILNYMKALDHPVKPISAVTRAHCKELNAIRRHTADYHRKYHLKAVHPISRRERRRAAYLRRYMAHNHISCKVGSPGKHGSITRH